MKLETRVLVWWWSDSALPFPFVWVLSSAGGDVGGESSIHPRSLTSPRYDGNSRRVTVHTSIIQRFNKCSLTVVVWLKVIVSHHNSWSCIKHLLIMLPEKRKVVMGLQVSTADESRLIRRLFTAVFRVFGKVPVWEDCPLSLLHGKNWFWKKLWAECQGCR